MSLLWGGRFSGAGRRELWDFTVSDSDRRLLSYDIKGSGAHVRMLHHVGLLTAAEEKTLLGGLESLQAEAHRGNFAFLDTDEDVHSAVERRLRELVGEAADKLHTGRSRNDQVSLDLRLYLRDASTARIRQLIDWIHILVLRAAETEGTVVAAFTHLQQAQAIPLSHHLLAYAWMFVRDVRRFQDGLKRISVSPLGAGAVGGSSLPIDPAFVAKELGFSEVFDNSMDATASRDFVSEYAFCAAQTMVHFSRVAEELVLWSTKEFGWLTLPDELSTGSSMLPQKKNPDIAELARGKSAGAIGDVTALLVLQKGLPLAYNRDLQEDKQAVFRLDDTLAGTLKAMTALVAEVKFHPPRPDSSVLAIDLAERLVERGVPFRQAHRAVGELVLNLSRGKKTLGDARWEDFKSAHPKFEEADLSLLDPIVSIEHRRSAGGAFKQSTQDQIKKIRHLLREV